MRRPEVREPKIRKGDVAEAGVREPQVQGEEFPGVDVGVGDAGPADVAGSGSVQGSEPVPSAMTPDTFVEQPEMRPVEALDSESTGDPVSTGDFESTGSFEPTGDFEATDSFESTDSFEDFTDEEEPAVRKPGYVDQLQRKERLRDTLLQAAYPEEEGDPESAPEESTDEVAENLQQTQPVRIVSEAIHPVSELGELPPDERFMTSKVPLTRRKRQTTVNPDFARARARSRRSFDSDMLELPDAPVYKIAEEERDALQAMNDVPSRLDIREDEDKGGVASELLDFVKLIILALILGVLLTQFVIQRSVVDGSSMHPTLLHKDQLIVEKVSRYFGAPKRGQLITIHHPDNRNDSGAKKDDLVKRVIGLPGETVEVRDSAVYINGELLDEPYIDSGIDTRPGRRGFDEVTLGENEVYVLGDNRPHSSDSRGFGPILLDEISGSVFVRIWPLDRFGIPR